MMLEECRGIDWCRRIEGELRAANGHARNLIEANPDPMMVVDLQGVVADVNRATEEISGISCKQLIGSEFIGLFSDPEQACEIFRHTLEQGRLRDCLMSFRHATRRMAEVLCNASLLRDDVGKVCGVVVVVRDISDFKQVESQMLFLANYDALTALPNRMLLREHLGQAVVRANRSGRVVGLMFVDLDNFKDVNETLGYELGDELIKATARRFRDELRESDVVARMGGDEFAILIEDVPHMGEVENLALKLLALTVEPHFIDGHEVVVSCCIGITFHPFDDGSGSDSDVDTLLRNADAALYRAKAEGKNCCRYFTAEMNATIRRRVELGNRLRRALNDSQFMLHYQPRVELAGGRIAGVEALVRWNAPGIGMVSPAEFIPIAENNGMIIQIGEWVLFEACRQAKKWLTEFGMSVCTAVNLSARQFLDVDIVALVRRALEQTGLPAHLLELELTESMLMQDTRRVQRDLGALREIGVKLSVDDFGTGYSSLSYLNSFPIDCLKVDRSFVSDIAINPGNEAIVRAIVVLAHSLGMKVVAEGVETIGQLAFLLDQDCEEIQGYYFSKPLPPDAMTALLLEGRVFDLGKVGCASSLSLFY
jgi:diguanylate cyclase (GGDEF)-like protein/PAS domain S-box-containing protein